MKIYGHVQGLRRVPRKLIRLTVLLTVRLSLGTKQAEMKFCDVFWATVPCGLCGEHSRLDVLSSGPWA